MYDSIQNSKLTVSRYDCAPRLFTQSYLSLECSGSENQKCCSINLFALKARCWFSGTVQGAGVWCMVSPTPGKMASPSPSPSCDVVRWPGAARAGLHHRQCPQLLLTQPGGHLQSRLDTCPDTRTRAHTRGHVSRHHPSSAVGEYSDEYNS